MSRFTIKRDSGKSAAEVLCDLVEQCDPGQLLSYERIGQALSDGADREYSRRDVQAAVCRAERQIATRQSRALINVAQRGYRVAMAGEHQMIAGRKRDRSSKLLKRGLTILQHVNWSEMTPNERQAHEGHLLVMASLHQATRGIEERLSRVEKAIRDARNSKD